MAVMALPASAAVSCGFAAGTVTVTLNADADPATVKVNAGAIEVNGAPCSTATTANTDTIDVVAAALVDVEAQT